jgi:hypothetical protein
MENTVQQQPSTVNLKSAISEIKSLVADKCFPNNKKLIEICRQNTIELIGGNNDSYLIHELTETAINLHKLTILVGCLDNHLARLQIHEALKFYGERSYDNAARLVDRRRQRARHETGFNRQPLDRKRNLRVGAKISHSLPPYRAESATPRPFARRGNFWSQTSANERCDDMRRENSSGRAKPERQSGSRGGNVVDFVGAAFDKHLETLCDLFRFGIGRKSFDLYDAGKNRKIHKFSGRER